MKRTIRLPSLCRCGVSVLTLVSVAMAVAVLMRILAWDGLGILDLALTCLFAVLFLWVSFSFWLATAGFLLCLLSSSRGRKNAPETRPPETQDLPTTAVLVPVYNEDPWQVFAGLTAMHQSLGLTGQGQHFDFFVLSDTTDPQIWLEEELAYGLATDRLRAPSGVYYRRRPQNTARKSGNIAEFCQRWGGGYAYMIVLDADSVLAGKTMVEMVRRMEADPSVGILQVPPAPVNRGSLFARLQEFAASVYGKVFTAGFALWSRTDGNYWGHNAIIRVAPFVRHCGLPVLPGKAPLGGEILSHDFVEAALMRRAGWQVHLAHDLGGSYEECPTTLIDFAQRDQRWCQGNLQHLSVMFGQGLHLFSRLHMGMGVMSYLSSLLWLLFMVLSVIVVAASNPASVPAEVAAEATRNAIRLFLVTMLLLLLPKLWGYLLLLTDARRLAAHGGALRAAGGVLLETLVSILTAPVMMAFHATFVILTLLGRTVQWSTQRRQEVAAAFHESFTAHAAHTICGLAAIVLVGWLAPEMAIWLSPVLAGLVLSIPLSMLLSSVRIGQWLRHHKVLVITEETQTPLVLRRQSAQLEIMRTFRRVWCRVDPFLQVVVNPLFNALHIGILKAAGHPGDSGEAADLHALQRVAFYGGPQRMSSADKLRLLSSESALRWLHESAWKNWAPETLAAVLAPVLTPPTGLGLGLLRKPEP